MGLRMNVIMTIYYRLYRKDRSRLWIVIITDHFIVTSIIIYVGGIWITIITVVVIVTTTTSIYIYICMNIYLYIYIYMCVLGALDQTRYLRRESGVVEPVHRATESVSTTE